MHIRVDQLFRLRSIFRVIPTFPVTSTTHLILSTKSRFRKRIHVVTYADTCSYIYNFECIKLAMQDTCRHSVTTFFQTRHFSRHDIRDSWVESHTLKQNFTKQNLRNFNISVCYLTGVWAHSIHKFIVILQTATRTLPFEADPSLAFVVTFTFVIMEAVRYSTARADVLWLMPNYNVPVVMLVRSNTLVHVLQYMYSN